MRVTRARVIDQVSSISDHILFVTIFVIGALAIAILRLLTNIPSIITLIVPLTLMGMYGFIVWRTERYRLREDRAADNIYYLGFLFTVTTLMVALVRYGTDDNPDVNQIIGDLGVGLITTIVGLVGRIFFGQLRQDPEEIEEQTRLMLSEVVEQTKAQLVRTNEAIDDLNAGTIQILRGAQETLNTTNDGVVASVAKLEEKLDQVEIPPDLVSKKIDGLFIEVERSLNGFSRRIDAVDVPPDLVAKKLTPLLSELDVSIQTFVAKISRVRLEPDLLTRKVDTVFEPLNAAADTLGQTFEQTSLAFAKIKEHREELSGFAEVAAKLGEEKERLADWSNAITANESGLVAANRDLLEVQKTLSSTITLVKELQAGATTQQQQYGEATRALVQTVSEAQAQIETLSKTTEDIAKIFAGSMRELVDIAASDVSGSRFA